MNAFVTSLGNLFPAAKGTTQRQWDCAILSREEFVRIYGEYTPEPSENRRA